MANRSKRSAPIMVPEGSYLHDRYLIKKILGQGASGTVYRGYDEHRGQDVALKVFPATLRENKLASARLHREIRSAYKIQSDYVTSLYDCHISDEYILLSLEYVHGQPLSSYLKQNGTIPIPKVCRIIRQVARGLEAIHEQNIVHRDIKLENIIISNEGVVKITDFGISLWDEEDELPSHTPSELDLKEALEKKKRLTLEGKVVGTLQYISPEYLLGEACDARSDIYALGVLMYELITSKYLYKYSNHAELMDKKVNEDPAPPISVRQDCPEWLSNICMKALNRYPEKRYQTAREVAFEFNRPGVLFAADATSGFSTIGPGSVTRTSLMDLHHQSSHYSAQYVRSRTRFSLLGALASLILAPFELLVGGSSKRSPVVEMAFLALVATVCMMLVFRPDVQQRAFQLLDEHLFGIEVAAPSRPAPPTTVKAFKDANAKMKSAGGTPIVVPAVLETPKNLADDFIAAN